MDKSRTTIKEQEGRDAFAARLGLDANPYSLFKGRCEWSAGWFAAREEAYAKWMKKIEAANV